MFISRTALGFNQGLHFRYAALKLKIINHNKVEDHDRVDLVWFYGLSTIFQLYHGVQFYWWRKLEYPEKTTDLSQVTD